MTDFEKYIQEIEEEYNIQENNNLLEICFLKIWVDFEKRFLNFFEDYCLGVKTEKGYQPKRILKFDNSDHLRHTISRNKDYYQIKDLEYFPRYILKENADPFEKIFNSNSLLIKEMIDIRNHIAHNSDRTIKKYEDIINKYSANCPKVNDFLKRIHTDNKSHYSTYIDNLKESIKILEDPTTYLL